MQTEEEQGWMNNYTTEVLSKGQKYQLAFYFIVTTITTVGYGDIVPHPDSFTEKQVSIIMMLIGQISFSYLAASLTAIITRMDIQQTAFYNEDDLKVLDHIIHKYGPLPIKLHQQLIKHIHHNDQNVRHQILLFQTTLPPNLNEHLNACMYHGLFHIPFFRNQNLEFVDWIES